MHSSLLRAFNTSCVSSRPSTASVRLQGKKRKDTICIVLAEENCDEHKIRMNKVVRSNLRIRLGDIVSVHQVR